MTASTTRTSTTLARSAARSLINALEPNTVPVEEIGHGSEGKDPITAEDAYPAEWTASCKLRKLMPEWLPERSFVYSAAGSLTSLVTPLPRLRAARSFPSGSVHRSWPRKRRQRWKLPVATVALASPPSVWLVMTQRRVPKSRSFATATSCRWLRTGSITANTAVEIGTAGKPKAIASGVKVGKVTTSASSGAVVYVEIGV